MKTRTILWTSAALLAGALCASADEPLPVFQDLDEVTSRIPNLKDKPFKKLIDGCGGFLQSEVIIFKDVETGHEVWSLSREECTDMAHTGRRPAWSCDGKYISFRGDQVFWNLETNQLWQRTWAGYSYVASADGSRKRPLFATVDGKPKKFNCDKYNMWDAKRPGEWYTIEKGRLWRVAVDDSLAGSKAEMIFTFPNAQPKVIQEISDDDFMLVEEEGAQAGCYVVNLNKDPKDPAFCLSAPLKGAIHSGSFRFTRGMKVITGGYQDKALKAQGEVVFSFDDEKSLKPLARDPRLDLFPPEGVRMDHLWHGPPDDRAGYFGEYNGKYGLWLQMPHAVPVMMADVPDGHVTWCGHDPEWFFAAVGREAAHDAKYTHRLLACKADGKTVEIVCTPFDRMRPGGTEDYGAIPLPTQSRDGNKCWFHSSMLLSTSKNTGSYIAVLRRPYPPTEVTLDVGDRTTVKWKPNALANEVKGYHVYRSQDSGKTFSEVTAEAIAGTEFRDPIIQKPAVYAVTAEEWSRLESDTATTSTGAKITGWDKTPPAKVNGFKAEKADGLIRVSWDKSADIDLRYYNVYASSAGEPKVEQKRLLVSPPHDETQYLDWTAPKDKPVHYAITAIDRQGNESAPAFAETP